MSRVDLRPAVTFVAGLPHGVVHETNQNGFLPGGRQHERDTVNRTTYLGVLEVSVLHHLMFEVVLRKVSSVLNEIQW